MKKLQEISSEIIRLTTEIETNYPELYQYLYENPVTIPSAKYPNINIDIMMDYLESLNQMLKHHIETHKNNK